MKWIKYDEQKPKKEDCGREFLVAVKLTTRNEYQIAEWFDMEDGETDPFFRIENNFIGQQMVKRQVTYWAELIDLPS
jgi:hypothetical protein